MNERPPFSPAEVLIGASWYPEVWEEAEWERDADRMAELGFTWVRLFEFAWHRMEPAEGKHDFGWCRKVMDLCHERGIRVMAGTPTAAPPAWLTAKYPEVLKTGLDGRPARHGKRCHRSHVSARYRELAAGIADAMAEHLGDHPALHSWQIDNEMGGADYGEEATAAFREFLRRGFGSIEELNRRWGLEFWSQAYDDFDQIRMCAAAVGSREAPERAHPSLMLAISEFQNECWSDYIGAQCAAIRARSDAPISTNMTGFIGGMDWFRHNRHLDFVGASMYADLEHYHFNYCRYDRMRAEKPGVPFALLETAPNWSGGGPIWNIHHEEDGIRLVAWLQAIMGGIGTLFWQWRSHWAGQEMQHGTHVSQTGRWMPGRAAWCDLAARWREVGGWLCDHPAANGEVALMASNRNCWAFGVDPIHPDNDYQTRWRDDYHLPLVRAHIHRDVIGEHADLAPYKVVCVAHMPMISPETRTRLREWVEAGGVLVLGPLVGTRTDDFTAWRDREFGGLEELMGGESELRFTPHWIEHRIEVRFDDGHSCHPRIWCEGLRPTTGLALARYRGGWGDGTAAVLENRFGEGRVITIGCPVDEATWLRLVRRACEHAGVEPVAVGSDRVLVVPRVDHGGRVVAWGCANRSHEEQTVTLPAAGEDLLADGEEVGPEVRMGPLQVRLVRREKGCRR